MDDATFLFKIGASVICVLVSFEIAGYLLAARKGRGVSNRLRRGQPLAIQRLYVGLAGFFACCGIGVVFYVIGTWDNFFTPGPGSVDGTLVPGNIAELVFCIAGSCTVLALGAILSKPIWRALVVAPLVLAVIAVVVVPGWPFVATISFTAPACVVSLATIGQCTGVLKGKLRMSFQCIRAGMWALVAGFVTASPALDDVTGLQGTAVTELLLLAGLVLAGSGFLQVPSLNEVFAPSFIKELYLTAKDGRIVLRHQFVAPVTSVEESEQDRMDREAFASSIVGIDHLLHEISEGKGVLKTLVQQNDVLIIEFTPRFIGVLVSRMDLHELRFQLASLLRDAEASIPPAALEPGKETIDLPNKRYLSGRVDFAFRLHVKRLGSIVRKLFIAIEASA
jgi:hypothetical protein